METLGGKVGADVEQRNSSFCRSWGCGWISGLAPARGKRTYKTTSAGPWVEITRGAGKREVTPQSRN